MLMRSLRTIPPLIFLLLLCCGNPLYGQGPGFMWLHHYGGSLEDGALSIQPCSDGGNIVAGYAYSADQDLSNNKGAKDCWLLKLNAAGTIEWQKNMGGSTNDFCHYAQQLTDKGFILACNSASNDQDVSGNHGDYDFWLVRTDSSANILWQKSFGGSGFERCLSASPTPDGGFIACGLSESNDGNVSGHHGSLTVDDAWVIKTDSAGNLQWQKSMGGSGYDYFFKILPNSYGSFIACGMSNSTDGDVSGNHGNSDYWLVNIDNSGNILWQQSYGGSLADLGNYVDTTLDGGYILGGQSASNDGDLSSNHGGTDCWLVKTDSAGTIQWQQNFGGSNDDVVYALRQTNDSSYAVLGNTLSNDGLVSGNHGVYDSWMLRIDKTGNPIWERCLGGSSVDFGYAMCINADGGYSAAGMSESNDGDLSGNNGNFDAWVVRTLSTIGIEEEHRENTISIYPNPATTMIHIEVHKSPLRFLLMNSLGQIVLEKQLNSANEDLSIDNFTEGLYFYSLQSSTNIVESGKLILQTN